MISNCRFSNRTLSSRIAVRLETSNIG
ncbi:hypothetical protein VCHENC03_2578A, partial [Vibrio sp. HENC-03]